MSGNLSGMFGSACSIEWLVYLAKQRMSLFRKLVLRGEQESVYLEEGAIGLDSSTALVVEKQSR